MGRRGSTYHLKSGAAASAEKDLEPNPETGAGRGLEGGEKTVAESVQSCAEDGPGEVVT